MPVTREGYKKVKDIICTCGNEYDLALCSIRIIQRRPGATILATDFWCPKCKEFKTNYVESKID